MATRQQGSKPNNKKAAIPKTPMLPLETNPTLTYQTPQKATRLHNPKAKPQVE
jgi:hypothetical protein